MRRWFVVAAGVAAAIPAQAQTAANVYVSDATRAFEDLPSASDEDLNDLVLRYNQRCRIADPGGELLEQHVHFAPVAAGANLANQIALRAPTAPDRITWSVDGAAATELCGAATTPCTTLTPLYDDFRDAFAGAPREFVNTDGGSSTSGLVHQLVATWDSGPVVGSTCEPLDFVLRRPDEGVSIDLDSALPDGTPLAGDFPGDWAVPLEHRPVDVAYPRILDWLQATADGCTPGSCASEDWYLHPQAGEIQARTDLDTTAPLADQPTCDNGVQDQDETGVDCGGAVCAYCCVDTETPYDGIDNDCDPATPDDDLDGDTYGIATDCDDGDDQVHPGATEICDGIDNDCNDGVDEDSEVLGDLATCAADSCVAVRDARGTSASGEYWVRWGGQDYVVWCDTSTSGGGWTVFHPSDVGRLGDLAAYRSDDAHALVYLRHTDGSRFTTLVEQLPAYDTYPLDIRDISGDTLRMTFIPPSVASNQGTTQGLRSNGQDVTFVNCDGNGNSYVEFWRAGTSYAHSSDYDLALDWRATKASATLAPPSDYYTFTALHFGGCGTHSTSPNWSANDGMRDAILGVR